MLTPWEIREIRKKHDLSRAAFAELTGLGAASLGRWETGALIQSLANDRYLRLLAAPGGLSALKGRDPTGPFRHGSCVQTRRAGPITVSVFETNRTDKAGGTSVPLGQGRRLTMYINTFYSFKGGVGRTMALANVAVHLARRGRRVLLVDFDLEAPGLDTFPALRPEEPVPGLVDYVAEYLETDQAPDVRGLRRRVASR